MTLFAPGTDGLAAQNIVIVQLFDGFESGDFSASAFNWQLSSAGTSQANWTVQKNVVHEGIYAAQSGAIGTSSSSTLSTTLTVAAGEISFWRAVYSASQSGLLIFEIDGTPVQQWSGYVPWQQSFYWVPAGTHTFSWIYGKDTGTPAGDDAAWLDNVAFTPGTTLAIEGASSSDEFSFDASGTQTVVTLNGESRSFAPGEFTNYVFDGVGGTATLTGSATGSNSAVLNGNGSGQFNNSTAGYTVALDGMTDIHVNGHPGDTAQFYDSPGNDTFYSYADYLNMPLVGMYGTGYSNSASGCGTNIGYSTHGGIDSAVFFDAPGDNAFYAYADYNNSGQQLAGMYGNYGYGNGYTNSAKGFAANAAESIEGGTDTAVFHDAPGTNSFLAYGDYNNGNQRLASLSGSYNGGYFDVAAGFATNVAYATTGNSDTATFYDSVGNDTFEAYMDYNNTGQPLTEMFCNTTVKGVLSALYTNQAIGFGTNIAYSNYGGNDTANFYGGGQYYYLPDYKNSDRTLAGMYGTGYTCSANGFGNNFDEGSAGQSTSSSQNGLSTDAAIAQLYGSGET